MTKATVGYLTAFVSALANGSFASLMKAPAVTRLDPPVHPLVFQLYSSVGVFLSSMLALIFLPYNDVILDDKDAIEHVGISYYGILAGALFVSATAFSFVAIPLIGVSLAQGMWGGCAILVSYFWGVAVFGNRVVKPVVAPFALLLLLIGIVGIAFCDKIFAKKSKKDTMTLESESDVKESLIATDGEAILGTPVEDRSKDSRASEGENKKKKILGSISAILVGLTGGSVLVPAHFEKHFAGVAFLPSFGLGAIIGAPILFTGYSLVRGEMPTLHLNHPVGPIAGIMSGVIWNIGNILQLISIPRITYSVAYSIYQCALFFSGLWGILLFKEIKGALAISIFSVSAAILITGEVLLSISTKQK